MRGGSSIHGLVNLMYVVFAHNKRKKYMLTSVLQSNIFAGFFRSVAESLKNLKDTTAFHRFLCVRIEIDQL